MFSRHSIEHILGNFLPKVYGLLVPDGILFCVFPLQQWAILNQGGDDEKDTITEEDAMTYMRSVSPFDEVCFANTWECGIKRMDNDYLYIGRKNG